MKTLCGILFLALASLASAQTPPTIPCANGQPYTLNPKTGKYVCPAMPICPHRCTMDDGHPYATCYAADRLMWWKLHDLALVHNEADGSIAIYDWTGFRVDNQTVNGYRCAYEYRTAASERCKPGSTYPWCT